MASLMAVTTMMKMGVCYVPIEIETWSGNRVAQVLETVKSAHVISTEDFQLNHPGIITREDIEICLQCGEEIGLDRELQTEHTSPDDLAYMIFTSGTSGAPKGVCVARKSLDHYVKQSEPDKPFNLGAGRGDKVLLIFSVAF